MPAAQTSNCLESEEYSLFAVRSMHTSCRLHGPFGADVYSTRKHLHVKHFSLLLVFFSLLRSPLMVLVSYTELFTTDFVVEYFVPYIGT